MKETDDFICIVGGCNLKSNSCELLNHCLYHSRLINLLSTDDKSPICLSCYSQKFISYLYPNSAISFCSNVLCPTYYIIERYGTFWVLHNEICLFFYNPRIGQLEVNAGNNNKFILDGKDNTFLFSFIEKLIKSNKNNIHKMEGK